jgi:AraC-like DNA-binding protein
MSIAAVSSTLSFSSQSYFTKVFKLITSTTPQAYRSVHRAGD